MELATRNLIVDQSLFRSSTEKRAKSIAMQNQSRVVTCVDDGAIIYVPLLLDSHFLETIQGCAVREVKLMIYDHPERTACKIIIARNFIFLSVISPFTLIL